jgi:hypothetical protein
LKTFLLERATQNEIVALSLYWYVKVEVKDTKTLNHSTSSSGISTISAATSSNNINSNLSDQSGVAGSSNQAASDQSSKTNFQIFMDELLENLRNVRPFFFCYPIEVDHGQYCHI